MSKKIMKIVIAIIVVLVIGLGVLYLIDMNRMKNNESVFFSTWGRDYTVPVSKSKTDMGLKDVQIKAGEEAGKTNEEETFHFFGKVIESNENTIIVEPNKGEAIRKSADKISVGLGKDNDAIYKVGSNVKVTYKGYVMETYPAQIDVVNIELKSIERFELKFYDKQPQTDKKLNKILDKTETKQYNYNIYAYEGSANIVINDEEISLKQALLENKITMDEIIAKANEDLENKKIKGDMYRDGGSMLYQYKNYTIIKCHTLDGNRNVYIGTPGISINDILN